MSAIIYTELKLPCESSTFFLVISTEKLHRQTSNIFKIYKCLRMECQLFAAWFYHDK